MFTIYIYIYIYEGGQRESSISSCPCHQPRPKMAKNKGRLEISCHQWGRLHAPLRNKVWPLHSSKISFHSRHLSLHIWSSFTFATYTRLCPIYLNPSSTLATYINSPNVKTILGLSQLDLFIYYYYFFDEPIKIHQFVFWNFGGLQNWLLWITIIIYISGAIGYIMG
jgi:hypothetical protein